MPGWITILPNDGNPNAIIFDGTISETHDLTSTATKHAIEFGSSISDHVRRNPIGFACEVAVSDQPLYDLGRGEFKTKRISIAGQSFDLKMLVFPEKIQRIKEVFDDLEGLIDRNSIVSIITSIKTYDNMVLVKIGLPRNSSSKNIFSLQFEQIKIVDTATVPIPKTGIRKSGAKAKITVKDPKEKAKSESLLNRALKSLGAFDG